jgi:hypothetical protein
VACEIFMCTLRITAVLISVVNLEYVQMLCGCALYLKHFEGCGIVK